MKYLPTLLFTFLALLLVNCSSNTEQASQVDPIVMAKQLDSLLQSTAALPEVAGVAIAVVSAEDVLYSKAFGISDITTGAALGTDHVFNFTSIVKTFSATAVMQQVEKGELELDKSAATYWEAPFKGLELATLRQMLSHSSGLQFTDQPAATNGQLAPGDLKLTDIPGYKLKYSNAAFYSLGQLVAQQTETDFPGHVTTKILEPLGMKNTSIFSSDDLSNVASGHTMSDNGLQIAVIPSTNLRKVGNGILYSTIEDMAIWAQMHLNRGTYQSTSILEKDSYKELWRPNLETGWDAMKAAAGLGCFIGKVGEYPSVSHIGGGNGYSAAFVLLPGEDRGIIIVGNSNKLPREALIKAIAEIAL